MVVTIPYSYVKSALHIEGKHVMTFHEEGKVLTSQLMMLTDLKTAIIITCNPGTHHSFILHWVGDKVA